jgi:hypothetical protein
LGVGQYPELRVKSMGFDEMGDRLFRRVALIKILLPGEANLLWPNAQMLRQKLDKGFFPLVAVHGYPKG